MRIVREAAVRAAVLCVCALGACDAGVEDGAAPADSATTLGVADGTDIGADPAATTARVCALVEESAAEEVVGFDVVMNDNTTGNCVLTPASGAPSAPAFDFRVEPRTNPFDYFSAQPDATPIDGLGDRAVWATLNEMTGYVVVVREGRSIVVAVARSDGLTPDSRPQAEGLARLLLQKN